MTSAAARAALPLPLRLLASTPLIVAAWSIIALSAVGAVGLVTGHLSMPAPSVARVAAAPAVDCGPLRGAHVCEGAELDTTRIDDLRPAGTPRLTIGDDGRISEQLPEAAPGDVVPVPQVWLPAPAPADVWWKHQN